MYLRSVGFYLTAVSIAIWLHWQIKMKALGTQLKFHEPFYMSKSVFITLHVMAIFHLPIQY